MEWIFFIYAYEHTGASSLLRYFPCAYLTYFYFMNELVTHIHIMKSIVYPETTNLYDGKEGGRGEGLVYCISFI